MPEQERTRLEAVRFTRRFVEVDIAALTAEGALLAQGSTSRAEARPHKTSAPSLAQRTGYPAAVFPCKTEYLRQGEKWCEVPVSNVRSSFVFTHTWASQDALLVADIWFKVKNNEYRDAQSISFLLETLRCSRIASAARSGSPQGSHQNFFSAPPCPLMSKMPRCSVCFLSTG